MLLLRMKKGASLISADIRIKNPDEDIFLGVDAKVTIHAEEVDNVVVLPSEVVNIGKEGSFCYVLENGVITKKDITTGISSDEYVEVLDGIKEGDEVIRDLGFLEEGMQAEAADRSGDVNGENTETDNAEGRCLMGGLYEYIKMAVQNIRANKGRSFLTMLGIIIGIASVIAIVSIGEGTKNQMNSEIDGIGSGLIAIDVSNDAMTEDEWITPDDVQEIRKLDTVGGVSVSNNYDGETVTGKGNFSIMLTGEGPDAKMINNSDMKYGSYFGETEIEEGKNVCVISDTDARQLFGTDDVVGMSLDITCYDSSKSFRIMGVTTQKENGTFVSYTYDGMPVTVNVPYSSMDDLVGGTDEFYSITVVQADKTLDSQIVADQVVHLLEKRHQCAGEDYFHVQSFQDVLQSMNEMLGMVTAFISFVAGISLLVGGIGVMNIMLVSVTERTREIGIRKSLGAKTSSIMLQFLAEAAILTVMGGVIGIILGILAGYGICSIMSGSMGMTITPGISPTVILAATLFSCAVGVFFGIYPAKKAAKLSPIEALRRN